MADAHGDSGLIKTGDLITLYSEEKEEDGYLACATGAAGADPNQVIVKADLDKDCVLKIMPMMQYREGADAQGAPPIDVLQSQLEGKVIIYGQIIQLMHARTQRYVATKEDVTATTMAAASAPFELVFTKEGSRSCWFKIQPHVLSTRQGGDKVMQHDKIRLEHVQTGCVLHQSETLNQRSQFVVDLRSPGEAAASDAVTPWLVAHSTVGGAHRAALKHGSLLRLCDAEAGYLRAPPGCRPAIPGQAAPPAATYPPLKARSFGAQGNELVASYGTIFEVLDEATSASQPPASQDEEITWNRPVRLRPFGTKYYVTVRPHDESSLVGGASSKVEAEQTAALLSPRGDVPDEYHQLGLTDDPSNPHTIFSFAPLKKESEEIPYGASVLIMSVPLHCWVHCSDDHKYSTGKKGAQESEVFCSRKFSFKDAFAVKPVPKYQLEDFDYVMAARLPTLISYVQAVTDDKRVDRKRKIQIVDILSELIRFVTTSEQPDPFKREGVPHVAHQALLGRKDVLQALFSLASIGDKQDMKITQLAYLLLRHIVRDHPKNGATLHSVFHLPVFDETFDLEKVEYYKAVPVARVLVEMYKGNADLTYGLTDASVTKIFEVLKTTSDPQYIDILRSWCTYRGQVVYNNQRAIAQALLAHAPEGVLMKTRHKGSSVQVKSSRDWVDILEFTAPRKFAEDEVTYHLKMLCLFSDLCVGRNMTAIKILTSAEIGTSYEEAFWCVRNKFLEPLFRAAYCDILLNVFVDIHPQSASKTAFKKVWFAQKTDKILGVERSVSRKTGDKLKRDLQDMLEGSRTQVESTTLAGLNYELEEAPGEFKTQFENPNTLQEFLIDYLCDEKAIRFDQKQQQSKQPHFLARVLVLMRKSFEFEVFKRKEHQLLPRFKAILEVCEDRDYLGAKRQLEEPEMRNFLIEMKLEVIKMLDRYLDLMHTSLFSKFMQSFAKETLEKPGLSEAEAKRELAQRLQAAFRDSAEAEAVSADAEVTKNLVPALLLQLHHKNTELTERSMACMTRLLMFQSKAATLIKTLTKVQLLVRAKDKDFYVHCTQEADRMRELAASRLDQKTLTALLALIDGLAEACEEDEDDDDRRRTNQEILRNTDLHRDILSIVQLPMDVEKSVGAKGRSQLLCACYNFLRMFVAGNALNQRKIVAHLDFMISQLLLYAKDGDVPRAITECLIEVFTGNEQLAASILDKHLRPFVSMAFEYKSEPVYFRFLGVIMTPGRSVMENQNLVMRLVNARPETKQVLADEAKATRKALKKMGRKEDEEVPEEEDKDEEDKESKGKKEKKDDGKDKKDDGKERLGGPARVLSRRIPAEEPTVPLSTDSAFVVQLVGLLAGTARGRNFFTERNCQKLLSLEEIVAVCYAHRDRSYQLLAAYLQFADEVYLNVDSPTNEAMPAVASLQYNKRVWALVGFFAKVVERVVADQNLLTQDFSRFLFSAMLPFVEHLYANAFALRHASAEQIEASNRLLDAVYELRECTKRDRTRRIRCTLVLKAMHAVGILGEANVHEIDKIVKSAVSNVANTELEPASEGVGITVEAELAAWADIFTARLYRVVVVNYCMEDCKLDNGKLVDMSNDETFRDYIKIFVQMLSDTTPHPRRDKLRLLALRFVKEFLDYDGSIARNIKTPLWLRQGKLAELEAPVAMVTLLGSPNERLVRLALATLISALTSRGSELAPPDSSQTSVAAVLTRHFSSQNGFFQDAAALFAAGRTLIKDFRKRAAAAAASFYQARRRGQPNVFHQPVAVDIGLSYQQLEDSLEMPPDLAIADLCHLLELLANDRESSIFKSLLADLIKEIALYIKAFERSISKSNMVVAVKLFQCLASAVRGSAANQQAAISSQVLHAANRLLLNTFRKPYEEGEDPELTRSVVELKTAVVSFLLALAESGDADVKASIIAQVASKGFEETTSALAVDKYNLVPPSDEAVALGSKAFRLIKLLVDADPLKTKSYRDSLEQCEAHTRSRIGRIEVVNLQNKLETIYFPIPPDFRQHAKLRRRFFQSFTNWVSFRRDTDSDALNQKAETNLNRSLVTSLENEQINWDRSGDKIDGFMHWAEHNLLKRELAQDNARSSFGKLMVKYWPFFWNLSFIISLVINGFILFSTRLKSDSLAFPTFILGCVQVALALIVLVAYFVRKRDYVNAKRWITRLDVRDCYILLPWKKIRDELLAPMYYHTRFMYYLISLWNLLSNPMTLYYVLYLAFAVAGVAHNRLWFCFHLFQILVRSQHVKFVSKALRLNAATIGLTIWIFLNFQYVFGVVAFTFFQDFFTEDAAASNCKTVMQCFLTLVYFGVPNQGALDQFSAPYEVDPWDGSVDSLSYAWVSYHFAYWFVCTLVGNVIFAVIVDTFGQMRENRNKSKEALGTTCFICSLERDAFQQQSKDFLVHQEKEHNRLHYFYFFAYLKDRQRALGGDQALVGQSDIEADIVAKVAERNFLKFFPVGRALSLEGDQVNDEELAAERINTQLFESTTRLSQLIDEIKALKSDLSDVKRIVDGRPSIASSKTQQQLGTGKPRKQ